jgi:hypothetical protein
MGAFENADDALFRGDTDAHRTKYRENQSK